MSLHYKIGGVWTTVIRPYVKIDGIWTPVKEVHLKDAGVWDQVFEWDVTPPNSPEISLQIIETSDGGQHIKVGVRQPGGVNDPTLKRIRVLTNYPPPLGDMPTTYKGGTYTLQSDKTYPNEPWSEWHYNDFGSHSDTSAYVYKQWGGKPNPSSSFVTPTGTYKFAAWSEDENGNWSTGTFTSIFMPKPSVDASNKIYKEKVVQANNAGSVTVTGGFDQGVLTQQNSPNSYGLWFYGSEFTDSVGANGTPTITSAQIRITRENDNGSPAANLYLFWHDAPNAGALPAPPSSNYVTKHNTTFIGTINKGQTAWYKIPESMWDNFNTDIKGFGLAHKDPIKASAFAEDYSVITDIETQIRCGEVRLVWNEKP